MPGDGDHPTIDTVAEEHDEEAMDEEQDPVIWHDARVLPLFRPRRAFDSTFIQCLTMSIMGCGLRSLCVVLRSGGGGAVSPLIHVQLN